MADKKVKQIIKRSKKLNKFLTYTKVNKNKKYRKNKKKRKNNHNKKNKNVNIKKYNSITKTRKVKKTKKLNIHNLGKGTKNIINQSGGTSTNSTTYIRNRNVEQKVPLKEVLRFNERLDQNVNNMDLGTRWPGKPPYPPECCIM